MSGSEPGWRVGSLAGAVHGSVDRRGALALDDHRWRLGWWVGAEDRWRDAAQERAVRQRAGDAPVVETALRVPGGDAVHRVYGTTDPVPALVVEVENTSASPFVAALVLSDVRRVEATGASVAIDRAVVLSTRAPARWAAGTLDDVRVRVTGGRAEEGAPARPRRRGASTLALLYPVAHRTTARFVIVGREAAEAFASGPGTAPGADRVAAGWSSWLGTGLRVGLPDEALEAAVRRGLADSALRCLHDPTPDAVAAMEDWGFDEEAARGWARVSSRARRRARSRARGSWARVRAALGDGALEPERAASLLLAVRALLVDDDRSGELDVMVELPQEWRGAPVEVHGAPTRHGPLSSALRWHGERAALLWDAPPGVVVRAPGLDPRWSSSEPRGEALLG